MVEWIGRLRRRGGHGAKGMPITQAPAQAPAPAPATAAPGGTAGQGTAPSPKDGEPGGARLVLFTRAGCHLCEEADRLLSALTSRRGESLARVDVDGLPADAREHYTDLVPVVTVDGREVARWRVDVSIVERALDGR